MIQANSTYYMNGVLIREKIIPDGTKWTNAKYASAAGFYVGQLYKAQKAISKVQFITIHNTEDIGWAADDGEAYVQFTYAEGMNSTRVHFYVDETGAWQTLKAGTGLCKNDSTNKAEVGWHAGDGDKATGGNMNSIALEIVMNENKESDAKAYDNGARMAAWLLYRHGLTIDKLVTHTYWVNKLAGKTFADVDDQCCNLIYGKKWCPTFIFNSNDPAVAKKNWMAFKNTVKKYLDQLKNPPKTTKTLYRVQIGAFSSQNAANDYLADAKKKGFDGFVFKVSSKLYRVQIGSFSSKTNAQNYLNKAKAAGFSGFIVTATTTTSSK